MKICKLHKNKMKEEIMFFYRKIIIIYILWSHSLVFI